MTVATLRGHGALSAAALLPGQIFGVTSAQGRLSAGTATVVLTNNVTVFLVDGTHNLIDWMNTGPMPNSSGRQPAVASRYNIAPVIDVYVSVQGTDLASVASKRPFVSSRSVTKSSRTSRPFRSLNQRA